MYKFESYSNFDVFGLHASKDRTIVQQIEMRLQDLPVEILSFIKSHLDNDSLAEFEKTCLEIARAPLSQIELSARRCKFYGKTFDWLIENTYFDCGHVRCFQYLKKKIADRDKFLTFLRDDNYALHISIQCGHIEMIKILLASGLTVDDIVSEDNWALQCASAYGHIEIVKLILEMISASRGNEAVISAIREDNYDALTSACQDGHVEVVKLLLKTILASHGFVSEAITNGDALYVATVSGHFEIVKLLLAFGPPLTEVRYVLRSMSNSSLSPWTLKDEKQFENLIRIDGLLKQYIAGKIHY